jgi:hypothetical protein
MAKIDVIELVTVEKREVIVLRPHRDLHALITNIAIDQKTKLHAPSAGARCSTRASIGRGGPYSYFEM